MSNYHHYVGCFHIHCPIKNRSVLQDLGNCVRKTGVDFLFLTPHSPERWKSSRYFSWEDYYGTTLILTGEEVDEGTERNHLLVYGAERWLGKGLLEDIIPELEKLNGMSFIAHPYGRHNIFGRRVDHRWTKYWLNNQITGLEIWSLLFDFGKHTNPVNLPFRYLSFPNNLAGPDYLALKFWDHLLIKKPTPAVCGLDIHALPFFVRQFDFKKTLTYGFTFKILRNHIFTRSPFVNHVKHDRALILEALKAGRVYCANDYLCDSREFLFTNADGTKIIGDTFAQGEEVTIQTSVSARFRIIHNGRLFKEFDGKQIHMVLQKTGFYRVEVYLDGKPWIFTNPIYAI